MRKYLNKESREAVGVAFRLVDVLEGQEEYIEKGKGHEEDKEKLKYLRMSITYLKKYLKIWTNNLTPGELAKILSYIDNTNLILKDNYQARLNLKTWSNRVSDETVVVRRDMLEDLLDMLIASDNACFGCNRDNKGVQNCKLREALIRYDAPATTEDPAVCQYEYKSLEVRKAEIEERINSRKY